MLINKRESTWLKQLNDSKAFIKYLNDMNDISKNIAVYNPNKKGKNSDYFQWYDWWYA